MIPDQLKQMFGLNSKQDMSMANNIWKMLDEMAESSPQQYKQFISKNLKQGAQQAKQKKQQKQKPFRIKPEKGFLLEFDVLLNQKYLSISSDNTTSYTIATKLQQKLDLSGQKWQQVRKKFTTKAHILLNVCYSDRVKLPLDKYKKQINQMSINNIKQIEEFYYSLQGPKQLKQNNSQMIVQWDYCMILDKGMFESLMKQGVNGKKMLMSMAISYFEQRLQTDRNPLLKLYNPQNYHKLAYYAVEKFTIQFNSDKNYFFNNSSSMQEFLLQKEIDNKRIQQIQPKAPQKKIHQQPKPQIKFKQQPSLTATTQNLITKSQQQQNHTTINQINYNKNNQQQNQSKIKKPLIQVLKQTQNQNQLNESLPYQIKSNDQGYHIEILTVGVSSIDQLSLEISDYKVKLKINKTQQNVEIELENPIDSDSAKAKLKKKAQRLIIDVHFLSKK